MDDPDQPSTNEDDLVLKNLSSVTAWKTILSDEKEGYFAAVDTLEEVSNVIREYEKLTVSQYITTVTNGDWKHEQGAINIAMTGKKVRFNDKELKVLYDGVPFIILAYKRLLCHRGQRKEDARDRKKRLEGKQKKKTASFAKVTCESHIIMKKIARFPNYKLDLKKMATSKRYQTQASQSVRMHDAGEIDVKYYIKLPPRNSHTNHTIGEANGLTKRLDKRLMDEVERLVRNQVQTTSEMKSLLRAFVTREIHPAPSLNDTSFYPTNNTICATIYRTRVKLGLPTTVEKKKGQTKKVKKINGKVNEHLKNLVLNGVRTVSKMRFHLAQFVTEQFDPVPSPDNEAYFPSDDTIRNHIMRYLRKSKHVKELPETEESINDLNADVDEQITKTQESGQIIFEDSDYENNFLSNMFSLWQQNLYTDLILHCGAEQFFLHRIVLATASPVLIPLIIQDQSSPFSHLHLENLSSDVLGPIINYFYSGKIILSRDNYENILSASKNLGIQSLVKICEQYVEILESNKGKPTSKALADQIKENPADETNNDKNGEKVTDSTNESAKVVVTRGRKRKMPLKNVPCGNEVKAISNRSTQTDVTGNLITNTKVSSCNADSDNKKVVVLEQFDSGSVPIVRIKTNTDGQQVYKLVTNLYYTGAKNEVARSELQVAQPNTITSMPQQTTPQQSFIELPPQEPMVLDHHQVPSQQLQHQAVMLRSEQVPHQIDSEPDMQRTMAQPDIQQTLVQPEMHGTLAQSELQGTLVQSELPRTIAAHELQQVHHGQLHSPQQIQVIHHQLAPPMHSQSQQQAAQLPHQLTSTQHIQHQSDASVPILLHPMQPAHTVQLEQKTISVPIHESVQLDGKTIPITLQQTVDLNQKTHPVSIHQTVQMDHKAIPVSVPMQQTIVENNPSEGTSVVTLPTGYQHVIFN